MSFIRNVESADTDKKKKRRQQGVIRFGERQPVNLSEANGDNEEKVGQPGAAAALRMAAEEKDKKKDKKPFPPKKKKKNGENGNGNGGDDEKKGNPFASASESSGQPAMIAGMSLSPRQLRSFLEVKKGKREQGMSESDNPVATVTILDFHALGSADLRLLADLVETGNVKIQLEQAPPVGANPKGVPDKPSTGQSPRAAHAKGRSTRIGSTFPAARSTPTSGVTPAKGQGDVGSNATTAPANQSVQPMTAKKGTGDQGSSKPGAATDRTKAGQTQSKGTLGMHAPGAGKENNNSSQTKDVGGAGANPKGPGVKTTGKSNITSDSGTRAESSEMMQRGFKSQIDSNLAELRADKMATEDVEKGYPNAERQGPGEGPKVNGGRGYKSPSLPSKAGGELGATTGPTVKGGKAGSLNPKMPGAFGNQASGSGPTINASEEVTLPTTLEGVRQLIKFHMEGLGTGVFGSTPPAEIDAASMRTQIQGQGQRSVDSIMNLGVTGMSDLEVAPSGDMVGTDGNRSSTSGSQVVPTASDAGTPDPKATPTIDKLQSLVSSTAPKAGTESKKIINTVVPKWDGNVSSLNEQQVKDAQAAIRVRLSMLGFDKLSGADLKLRRGLDAVMDLLRTQLRNITGSSF